MTTGERIRQARKNAGLTQAQLADKMGISAAGVAQWENDLRNPKIETIKKIAVALGVDAVDLYEEPVVNAVHDNLVSAGILRQMFATSSTDILEESLQLQRDFSILTKEGRTKALERVHELTEIPRYVDYPADVQRNAAGAEADDTDTDTSTEE